MLKSIYSADCAKVQKQRTSNSVFRPTRADVLRSAPENFRARIIVEVTTFKVQTKEIKSHINPNFPVI